MAHEGFDRRMDIVRDILREHGLEVRTLPAAEALS